VSAGPGYLDEAARLLRDATAALDRRAEMEEKTTDLAFHRSLMEDRLRLAEDYMRMEATRRDADLHRGTPAEAYEAAEHAVGTNDDAGDDQS
jgi:hypothetical protein